MVAVGRKPHISGTTVNIMKVDTIRIKYNNVHGSYDNGRESHVIHEFYPNVGLDYIIVEIPNTIIYLPENVRSVNISSSPCTIRREIL